jgi:hypothetical protein
MSDAPQKLPRIRQRVEAALKAKHQAAGMRRSADELAGMDPTGARFMRKDAAELEAKAEKDLSRWSYTTSTPELGNGGELVPIAEAHTDAITHHVREPADMLAHSASSQRMELAGEADALALALDAANSIKAQDSVEKMLAAQAAAAHKLAMRLMAKAEHQLSQVDTWNPTAWSAHSVEAARLANAAGKLMSAFSDAVLTIQRRRNGGKQVVQVIHQQVAVGPGGKAVVAGTLKGQGKTAGKLRGRSED